MGTFQRRLLGGAAALALTAAWGGARAQDVTFNIAPQPLASALNQFGAQSDTAVLVRPDLTGAKMTKGVTGAANAEVALNQLLDGTGLSYRREGDTFLIVRAGADPQSGSAAGGGAEVEALIVTAQKREEDIQDVPIAISAFSQEDLTRSQIAGGPDLITQVPNMTFTKTNFSSYSIQLRGIGTQAISATTDPAVAVAFNNTPFIRNRFFEQEFYDLQRVEVLRGPQGTLYGRNATAGVVNLISQKPRFVAEAKLSGDVGNFSSMRLEGMVNIPLVEDKVALRVAGAWTKRDGYVTNELTGSPVDGRDLWSTRVSLRVTPNDRFDANLIWEHFEEDDDRLRSAKQLCKKDLVTEVGGIAVGYDTGPAGIQAGLSQGCTRESLYSPDSFQTPMGPMLPYYNPLAGIGLPTKLSDPYQTAAQPRDLRVIQSTLDPDYRASSDLGELQLQWDVSDNLTLSSETAYAADEVYSFEDFNRFNTAPGAWYNVGDAGASGSLRPDMLLEGPAGGIFCDPQLGCSDRLVGADISTATASQFSQEFRLASNYSSDFNFSLGANFLRADSEDKYYVFFNSLTMHAADSLGVAYSQPWVGGQTDNVECLLNGYSRGNPQGVYPVQGCIYVDPNPIGSLNDKGHNYFLSKNPYKLISYAVFGEAYYDVSDTLKVTAGLRWTVDKKEAPRVPSWVVATRSVGYPVAEVSEQEWREPSGRLTIDWKPDLPFTDETMLYGSFSHGYKAGGANPPGFIRTFYSSSIVAEAIANASATRPKTFEAEFVNAFEIGSKNSLMDGAVTANLAAFYYDYTGYQISEIVDRSAFNRNFDATVWGIELESAWRAAENLRFGLKLGYEKTRVADGEEAIDLMDRTAGDPAWTLARPFPTNTSSCIIPTSLVAHDGIVNTLNGAGGGNPTACEYAYTLGFDPVTAAPYVPDPKVNGPGGYLDNYVNYPGWNPATAPNHGEGIMKPLGGNELPNAPNWTATITGDYTLPLPNEWLATLHTDLHWQSASWWRIFNDHEYNRLDEYFTMNLAAIFTNEERGWNIMAYIKNVTDETAITGAFLNSDDTGLTTNVFLTEPRLYGLRVTKAWTGGPLLGGLGAKHDGPYALTVELGGQVERYAADSTYLHPSFADAFEGPLDVFADAQQQDLHWGEGQDLKLVWRPDLGPWSASLAVRKGAAKGQAKPYVEDLTDSVCTISPLIGPYCELFANDPQYGPMTRFQIANHADVDVYDKEEYNIVDLLAGYDLSGPAAIRSRVQAGIAYVELSSETSASLAGVPDWNVPEGFYPFETVTDTLYQIKATSNRHFAGAGPKVAWDASFPVASADWGRLNIDWNLGGGVLFGSRETAVTSQQEAWHYIFQPFNFFLLNTNIPVAATLPDSRDTPAPLTFARSNDASVLNMTASLGLSYSVGAFQVGAGYRWDRYFDALDAGYADAKDADRTIDGPYFKIAVGFGG